MFHLHRAEAIRLHNRYLSHVACGNRLRAMMYKWVLKHSYA